MDVILKEYVEVVKLLENQSAVVKNMIVSELYFILYSIYIRSDYSDSYKLLKTPSKFITFLVSDKPKLIKDYISEYEIIERIIKEEDMDIKNITVEFIVWIILFIV